MNKYLILLFLISLTLHQHVTAQKIQFNDTTNFWYVHDNDPYDQYDAKTYKDSIRTDTIMYGCHYFYHTRFRSWIREDTSVAGRFYARKRPDSMEKFFMDYNLAVGDTFYFQGYPNVVTAVDSILINGVYHKIQNSANPLIEGIGYEYASVNTIEAPYFWLCCFENKGTRPVITSQLSWFNNTATCALSVDDMPGSSARAVISPNPVNTDSHITLPYTIRSGTLTIINAMGMQVAHYPIAGQQQLLLHANEFGTGLYCYSITDNEKNKIFTGKFQVEE